MSNFSAEELDQALSRCESEPIHQIGHIQPHGALLVLSPENPRIVLQASSNLEEIVDLNVAEVCGNPLALVIGVTQADQIEQLIQEARADRPAVTVVSFSHQSAILKLHARVFLSGSMFVLELIRDLSGDQGRDIEFSVQKLQRSLLTANVEKDIYRYFDRLATIVRELTGFDRVMVYRFDAHWDGEVIAESGVESAHSYLGMHFPASDIPPQARRLYTTNLVRQIADVDDKRVPVLPTLNPANRLPLDMTHSSLRSLSPVHVEYLRNMGVSASLSISLLQNGGLWGLIACHHLTPRRVPYPLLEATVLISEVVSTRLSLSAISAQQNLGYEASRIIGELLKNITTGTAVDLKSLLLPDLQALLSATGIVMVVEGTILIHGEVPESQALGGLLSWLSSQPATDVMSCDYLAKQYAPASFYADVAAGFLAAPVSLEMQNCIVWLRKAKTRTVHWAGRPEKTLSRDAAGVRLTPRHSFEGWTETWRERCEPWAPHEIEIGRLISEVLTKSLSQKSKLEIEQAKSKQAEQALAQQNRLLNSIIENIPHMIFLKRASDLRFEMFNRAGEALLGLDRSEILGRNDHDLFPRDQADLFTRADRTTLASGSPTDIYEESIKTPEGMRNLHTKKLTIYDEMGQPQYLLGISEDISKRQQAENTLKESEERFRGAFETAAHGMALVSLQGGFIKVNESLCVMLGYGNAELLATDFQTITHPDDLTADLNFLNQLLEGKIESYQMEKRYFHKKGHVIWILLSVSLVRTSDGTPVHYVAQIINITDRKSAEATLLAAKQAAEDANRAANIASTRLQVAMSSADMGIWDWDLVSGVLVWDERMYQLYGITSDTFGSAYEAWLSAVSVEDQVMANRAIELSLADVQPYDIEFRVNRPDGSQRWIKANGIVTRNAAGQPVSMAGINYDITQRLKVEAEVQASENRIRALFDTIVDGIIVIDARGRVQTMNPAAVRLFGYAQEEVQGRNIKMLMPAPYAQEHDEYLHNYLDTGVKKIISIGREVVGLRKDGSTFPMDLAVSEMLVDGQRMFTGIVRDVSPRKEAENALRAAKEAAETANRSKS
uniref:PAS domain S-box protein n=1 Tax=Undibacterium sp. TaxID=1914977 RepID=UPI00375143BB